MQTEYEVVITNRDCEDGVRGTEHFCVVSIALMALVRGATVIKSNSHTIRFTIKDEDGRRYRLVYPTPEVVRDYIRNFDKGVAPKPMKFTLKDPQVTETVSRPKGAAITPSFKAQGAPKKRYMRIWGERALVPVK